MLGELNETQINNLLSSQVVGRLACTDGDKPYIVPVTYTYDGEYIYGQTNVGKKLKLLRKNPHVCFEVDKMMDMRNWQSVIVHGKFEELNENDSTKAKEIFFEKVYPMQTSTTVHAHEHAVATVLDDSNRIKHIMYRIKIKKITGRYEKE